MSIIGIHPTRRGFVIKHEICALTLEIPVYLNYMLCDTDLTTIFVNITNQSAWLGFNHCCNCNHKCNCWFFFEVL